MHPIIARSVIRCWEREGAPRPRARSTWLAWLGWRR
jgi:hypothetical protein